MPFEGKGNLRFDGSVNAPSNRAQCPRRIPIESFNQNVIKHKTELLNLAAERGNISNTCKIMGFSNDTFYRYQAARDEGGVEALFEVSRCKPNLKNRVEESTELVVTVFALDLVNPPPEKYAIEKLVFLTEEHKNEK
ncbi:helix-turn-helix domain-containing protein [Desulfovibrio desulfuricans]|uniref:helix-turn-helix domain-containing protein n=1 Tax=Desulfovibrio desulfuricans TaxID=876 RepID=UPI00398B333B